MGGTRVGQAALGPVLLVLTGLPAVGQMHAGRDGAIVARAGAVSVTLGAPIVRFGASDAARLRVPAVIRIDGSRLRLTYNLATPDGIAVHIIRQLAMDGTSSGSKVTETLHISPSRPITEDVELLLPLNLSAPAYGTDQPPCVTLPLKNGWARRYARGNTPVTGEYRLGSFLTGGETPELALPVAHVEFGRQRMGVAADPMFSGLFTVNEERSRIRASIRWRYAGSQVPVKEETRRFAVWVSPADFPQTISTFFRLMLPDVPPGPRWVHEVAMVDYDYLSDDGKGWERDVRALATVIPPEERRRVALCFHGWYDTIGMYCYDNVTGRMRESWVAMARTRKVPLTQEEVRRRLRLARSLGFRVLLYFADGLLQDSATSAYRPSWDFVDREGNKISGWQGPDTWGATFARNPANPEVSDWYSRYLASLLRTYGPDLDGFVWDESFYIRQGMIAVKPEPAYADRAMLRLMRRLAAQVHAHDPQKVFLSSDVVGLVPHVPGYGMMAQGTYQDSACHPVAWSYGLFPNWRNALWSCNWSPMGNYHWTRWGVETFGVPVAVSNGWGDDRGPSEWSPWERDGILALFRERLRQKDRVRYLTEDPAKLLAAAPNAPAPGDPIPDSAPGDANWALDSNGGRAAASSEDDYGGAKWGPAGAIDGVRDDTGWGGGHGWASKRGAPLPQWIEVTFSRPHPIRRFVVITYQKDGTEESAGKWGVLDYDIQAPDGTSGWKTIVSERRGRVRKTRVHTLAAPIVIDRFRVLVTRVAPLDGGARLLQVEAWATR